MVLVENTSIIMPLMMAIDEEGFYPKCKYVWGEFKRDYKKLISPDIVCYRIHTHIDTRTWRLTNWLSYRALNDGQFLKKI